MIIQARTESMRQAFPLGTGGGGNTRAAEKRIGRSVAATARAEKQHNRRETKERLQEAEAAGKCTANGRPIPLEQRTTDARLAEAIARISADLKSGAYDPQDVDAWRDMRRRMRKELRERD